MSDLELCPFCDGDAKERDDLARGDFAAQCRLCGCGTPLFDDPRDAITAWNTRAPTEAERQRDLLAGALEPFKSLAKAVIDENDPGYRAWVSESADWMVVFSFAGQSINLGQLRALAALQTEGRGDG